MKYYEITCVRGHCGSGKSTNYITFYYKGANSVEAIMWAKRQPGVKHSRMPLGCFEISEAKYKENIKVSAYKRAFARQESGLNPLLFYLDVQRLNPKIRKFVSYFTNEKKTSKKSKKLFKKVLTFFQRYVIL